MRSRAPWPQMAVATVVVMVLPALVVGVLSALGVLTSLWAGALLAVALSLALSSAGSAFWRRHASGDVLFSDLLLWGWLRRRRTERRLGRADELLREAGDADSARTTELLRELGAALDAQDPYLDGHSRRVARYVTMIAQRMNLSAEQVERAKAAATVHDVGKLRIPAEVVNKRGRLTDAEFELMKQHAAAGGEMVECLGDPALAAAVRGHHERWDGSGYPDGLAGERIPVEARMISVADTFDAITSARPYRAATPHAKALKVIADEAGRQLDPEAARAFISCYSDRRGAALWAGLASMPRQIAGRLSTSPAELSGVLSAALTAPLVVVAAAVGAAAMPAGSGNPATIRPRRNSRRLRPPGRHGRPSGTARHRRRRRDRRACRPDRDEYLHRGAERRSGRRRDRAVQSDRGGVGVTRAVRAGRDRRADAGEPAAAGCAAAAGRAVAHADRGRPIAARCRSRPRRRSRRPHRPRPRNRSRAEPTPARTAAHAGAVAAAVPRHAAGLSHGDSDAGTAFAHRRRLQERRLDGPRLPEPGPVHRRRAQAATSVVPRIATRSSPHSLGDRSRSRADLPRHVGYA